MSVLDRLLGKTQGANTEEKSEGAVLVAQMAAEIATLEANQKAFEASQKASSSELEQEKQKSAGLQTKLESALSTLRAAATRMAVRAYGAEGSQIEMAKTNIEASEDPSVIGRLMESCEKAVPASLAGASGGGNTDDPATATSEQKAEKYQKVREQGQKANAPKTTLTGGK